MKQLGDFTSLTLHSPLFRDQTYLIPINAWAGDSESIAKEEGSQREARRTFKILREVLLNIEVKKIDTYEGVIVKALLDSGATGVFMDKRLAAK